MYQCTYFVIDRGKECNEQAFKYVFVVLVDGHRGGCSALVKTRACPVKKKNLCVDMKILNYIRESYEK